MIPLFAAGIFAALVSISYVWPNGWRWLEFAYPAAVRSNNGVTVTYSTWRGNLPVVVFFIGGALTTAAYLIMGFTGALELNVRMTLVAVVGLGMFPFIFRALPKWSITVQPTRVALTIDKGSKRMELVSDNPEAIKLDDPKRTLGVRFHNLQRTPRSHELTLPGLHKHADGSYYFDWSPHPTAGVKRSELV